MEFDASNDLNPVRLRQFKRSRQNTHDAMDTPWPQWLINSFVSANQPQFATDESVYYGPYTRLLYHLFGIEGPFEISPQYHIPQTRRDVIDVVALFTVELDKHPVLFIEVKDEYVAATNTLTPRVISPDPVSLNDVAPAERWSYDLLEANGIAQMRQVTEDVKAMCRVRP